MDTRNIDASKINLNTGWHIGSDEAPVKIVEFINLRCPHVKTWWEDKSELLTSFVSEGKVQRIVKHYDKDKDALRTGNILHQYVSYDNNKEAKDAIDTIYDRQNEWGKLSEDDVGRWAEKVLDLKKLNNDVQAEKIINEAKEANVTHVPTIFIGENIFDQHISAEELTQLIEEAAK